MIDWIYGGPDISHSEHEIFRLEYLLYIILIWLKIKEKYRANPNPKRDILEDVSEEIDYMDS